MGLREILAGSAVVTVGLRDQIGKGLKSVERRLRRFGSGVQTLGASLVGKSQTAVLGIGGALGAVATVFGSFDSKMAEVAAVSGATGEALESLRTKAKELGATTRFSASEAAEAMRYLAMAGMGTEEILGAIGPVLSTAAAGMMDLGRAADIVSDVTTAFGLGAEETARVADVLAATATSANTSIEQMGEAFTYAAAQGKAAGQTVEDVSAALGVLGNSGLKASIAGSGVQGIFKRLIQPDAMNSLRQMGIALTDAEGNIRPLSALMLDLRNATAGMTQLQRLQAFEQLFGLHAKSAIILADNADALRTMTGDLNNATGAADAMAATMSDSLFGRFLGLKSATEGIFIAIGEAINEPLSAAIEMVTSIARSVTTFIENNQTLVRVIGQILIGVVAAAGVITTLGATLFASGLAVSALSTAFGIAASMVAFIFSPLGAVVGALVAAGAAAFYFRDQLFAALAPVVEYAREVFRGIGDAITAGRWDLAVAIAWERIKLLFTQGWASVNQIWIGAQSLIGGAWDSFVGGLTAVWRKAYFGIARGFVFIADQALAMVRKLAPAIRALGFENLANNLEGLSLDGVSEMLSQMEREALDRDRAVIAARGKMRDERLAGALEADQAAIAAARGRVAALEGEAAAAREAAAAKAETPQGTADKFKQQLEELKIASVGATETTRKATSAGTFSSAAALSLAAGSSRPAEMTAKNTQKMLGVLQRMKKQRAGLAIAPS